MSIPMVDMNERLHRGYPDCYRQSCDTGRRETDSRADSDTAKYRTTGNGTYLDHASRRPIAAATTPGYLDSGIDEDGMATTADTVCEKGRLGIG